MEKTEKKVLKMGVVGCGRGRYMVALLAREENVKITAICDNNPEMLEAGKRDLKKWENLDVECYDDYEKFLKEADVDAVFVCTYATIHTKHVIMAMEAGKHILCEIPTINSLEDAKAVKAAVEAHPELVYMTAENACWWQWVDAWKKMHDDGKFGDIVYAEAEYLHSHDFREIKEPKDKNHWRLYNAAIKYLTHELGPLLYIMGDRCVAVSCLEPDRKYNPYRKGPANGVAMFKTAKGAVIRILICFGAYVGFDHNYRILGTRGSILTDPTKVCNEATCFANLSDIPGTHEEKIEIPVSAGAKNKMHGGADDAMMRDFVKCVLEGTKPKLDVIDGINMALPGIYAHESALKDGEWLEIPEV